MTNPEASANADGHAEGKAEGHEGKGNDSHEFPFLKHLGETLKQFGSGVKDSFKGQAEDAVHDVTDPVQKLKALIKVLSNLASQEEAKQGKGDAQGQAGAKADAGE